MFGVGFSSGLNRAVVGLTAIAVAAAFPEPAQTQLPNLPTVPKPPTINRTAPPRSPAAAKPPAINRTAPPRSPAAAKPPTINRTAPPRSPAVTLQSPAINRAVPESAYTLGAGDRIRLDVFGVPEYTGEYQVLVDGTLNLPVIGGLPVRGLTLKQASDIITARYSRYVRRPIITLSLLAARPLKIGVSGEVNRPGSYTIPISESRQFPTITQAIALAGGTTQSANVRQVQLRRRGPNGRQQAINLNIFELLRTGNLGQDITLRDGDTIFIPAATGLRPNEERELASASFAASAIGPLNVVVVGEVSRPGTYTVTPDSIGSAAGPGTTGGSVKLPTVTKAIQAAGGITPSANIRTVTVRRRTRTGADKVINVNLLQLVRSGNFNQDITLQDGDTIVIPTAARFIPDEARELASASFAASAIAPLSIVVVGEVTKPGTYTVAADSIGSTGGTGKPPTVTKALQVAGGITPSADIRLVTVRRRTRTGPDRTINVDLRQLLRTGNLSQDIVLQDGDTIFIPTVATVVPDDVRELASASFAASAIAPLNIVVVGEVTKPGTYTVAADNVGGTGGTSKPPTVTKAIQVAGGITPSANINSVTIRRRTRTGSDKTINLDLGQLLRAGNLSQDLVLQDGDTIFIPTAASINTAEAAQLAASNLAAPPNQPLKIAVVGEVFRPGPYTVTAEVTQATTGAGTAGTGTRGGSGSTPTVTKAIQVAGGITPSADIRSIEVRRSPRNGVEQVISVNLWQLLVAGDITQDLILQDGDTISVPKAATFDPTEASTLASASFAPNTITVNVVGEVQKPGAVQVPSNTPLNQALLAAGGFNVRARTQTVDLVRLNPNGTVTKRTVNVDFARGINDQTNPTVQNNDVIVVGRSRLASVGDTLGTVLNPVATVFSLFNFFTIFRR